MDHQIGPVTDRHAYMWPRETTHAALARNHLKTAEVALSKQAFKGS